MNKIFNKIKLFVLLSLIMLLSLTCQKDAVNNNYTFTITSTVLNKGNFPFAKVFLYDTNGNIVDEAEIVNNQNVTLTSTFSGKHDIAVFAAKSLNKDSYQFDYFYDVPNNSSWKYEKAVYNNLVFNDVSSPRVIELKNVNKIDSIKRGGSF